MPKKPPPSAPATTVPGILDYSADLRQWAKLVVRCWLLWSLLHSGVPAELYRLLQSRLEHGRDHFLLSHGQLREPVSEPGDVRGRPRLARGLRVAEQVVEPNTKKHGSLGNEVGAGVFGGAFVVQDSVARGAELFG